MTRDVDEVRNRRRGDLDVIKWSKTYATVIKRMKNDPETVWIRCDDGTKSTIRVRWGCGGQGRRIVPGARIKIYQRDGVNHPNFRMVGG